jgi:hypothetical protein
LALSRPRRTRGREAKPYAGAGGWHVPLLWPGSTVVCIGGGPSLTDADVAACKGRARVITVNDALFKAPWADVAYAADSQWWRQKGIKVQSEALKICLADTEFKQIRTLRYRPDRIIETDPHFLATGRGRGDDGIMHGGNSGYHAVNLAVLLGGVKIVLLAYDMGLGPNDELHWFGKHPAPLNNPTARAFPRWRAAFGRLAPVLAEMGVTVINASRRTALECFPRMSLEEALA